MADSNQVASFNPDTYTSGGGLWADKDVTITYAKAERVRYITAAGEDKTAGGEAQAALVLRGIVVGEVTEREERYSAGNLRPTEDGEGFAGGAINLKSGVGRFFKALTEAGFDFNRITTKDGKPHASGLVGATLHFVGVDRLDKLGKPIVDKNGYPKQSFFPSQVVGYGTATGGNGSVADDAINLKAREAVYAILTDKKTLSKSVLARELTQRLGQQADAMSLVTRALSDGFLRAAGAPWNYDGTTLTLPQ